MAVLHNPKQGKADGIAALFAARKERIGRQRGRMHQPVRAVLNRIDTGPWDQLPGLKGRIICRFRFCGGAQLFHASLSECSADPDDPQCGTQLLSDQKIVLFI